MLGETLNKSPTEISTWFKNYRSKLVNSGEINLSQLKPKPKSKPKAKPQHVPQPQPQPIEEQYQPPQIQLLQPSLINQNNHQQFEYQIEYENYQIQEANQIQFQQQQQQQLQQSNEYQSQSENFPSSSNFFVPFDLYQFIIQ